MGCCFSAATRFAFSCSRSFTSLGCRATLLSSSAATSRHATPCRLYTQTYIKTRRQLKERTAPKGGTSLGPGNPRAVTDTYPTKSSPPHKRYPTPQPSRSPTNTKQNTHSPHHTRRGTTKTPTPSCTRGLVTRQRRAGGALFLFFTL